MELQVERAVPSGIITMVEAFFTAMGLQQLLDDLLPYDEQQCKLTPGQRLTALLLCVFGGRNALYRVEDFYDGQDLSRLFGCEVQASDFNDDALARALDKLYAADPKRVFSTLSFHALSVQGIPWQAVHGDTTSVSLYGQYNGYEGMELLQLVPGYSKDGHPELNQLMIGMATTRDGIPLYAEVLDGNTSDKDWNLALVKELSQYLPEERLKQMLYVADSALVTKTNLAAMASKQYRFVSRLPSTFKEANAARDEAFAKGLWGETLVLSRRKTAARYKLHETTRAIDGRTYRLIVVHSTSLDRRKQKQLDKDVEKERESLRKKIKAVSATAYHCQEDALAAAERFSEPKFWQVGYQVQEVVRRRFKRPGRPTKNEEPDVVVTYRLVISVGGKKEDVIALEKERRSAFVLISNDKTLSAPELLCEYKEQSSVEQGFRFIKEPRHVTPVYLQRPDRIEAFCYVMALALLIYTLIQKKIRDALKTTDKPLSVRWRGDLRNPTTQVVLDVMSTIQTVTARLDGKRILIYTALTGQQQHILDLLGLNSSIFSTPT